MKLIPILSTLISLVICFVGAAKPTKEEDERLAKICGKAYPKPLNARGLKIVRYIASKLSLPHSLEASSTPQFKAMCWSAHTDKSKVGSRQMIERYALATLFYSTHGEKWEKSTNWLTSEHVCNWFGVTCDYWWRVVELDLGFNELNGIISREMGLLSNLQAMRLTANDMQGVIPFSFEKLKNLQVLQLNMNGIFGQIPAEIGKMTGLRELHIYGNYFHGTLPKELGDLPNLEILDLNANFIGGTIPKEISNAKKLEGIYLNDNNLTGSVPKEICDLKFLTNFWTDCGGRRPEVKCDCCTHCCEDGADPKCFKMTSTAVAKR